MHLADRDRERPIRTPRLVSPPPVRNGPKVTANEAAYMTSDQVRSPSTGPTLILTPSCSGYVGTLARVDGELVVTETKTAKSRRVVSLSPTAEGVARRAQQAEG